MAEYRGVSGIARQIVKQYRGVSNIARPIIAAWRGVSGVARKYFSSFAYRIVPPNANDDGDDMPNGMPAEYSQTVKDGVLNISGKSTGTSEAAIYINVYGDNIASKKITFNYTTSGYNAFYSTIELSEIGAEGAHTKHQLSSTSGSFSKTLSANTTSIRFSIWFGLSVRTASLKVSNLKIGGQTVLD